MCTSYVELQRCRVANGALSGPFDLFFFRQRGRRVTDDIDRLSLLEKYYESLSHMSSAAFAPIPLTAVECRYSVDVRKSRRIAGTFFVQRSVGLVGAGIVHATPSTTHLLHTYIGGTGTYTKPIKTNQRAGGRGREGGRREERTAYHCRAHKCNSIGTSAGCRMGTKVQHIHRKVACYAAQIIIKLQLQAERGCGRKVFTNPDKPRSTWPSFSFPGIGAPSQTEPELRLSEGQRVSGEMLSIVGLSGSFAA